MLFSMLRWSGEDKQSHPPHASHLHGYIFCAANEVQKLSATALTACDADRLCTVLANLQELAQALGSPQADRQDLAEWRQGLSVRVAAMRAAERREEREPNRTPVEVYIRTGLLPDRQRATA